MGSVTGDLVMLFCMEKGGYFCKRTSEIRQKVKVK